MLSEATAGGFIDSDELVSKVIINGKESYLSELAGLWCL
jgi:hypothetical protein